MKLIEIVTAILLCVSVVPQVFVKGYGNTQNLSKGGKPSQFDLAETVNTVLNATLYQQKTVSRNLTAFIGGSGCSYPRVDRVKNYVILKQTGNWLNALTLCKQKKMDLASIRSKEENDLFEKIVRESIGPLRLDSGGFFGAIWIGGTNLHSTDLHYWISDGQLFVYGFSNWYKQTSEPNNLQQEHCVSVDFRDNVRGENDYRPGKLGWNDRRCEDDLPYVGCEFFV